MNLFGAKNLVELWKIINLKNAVSSDKSNCTHEKKDTWCCTVYTMCLFFHGYCQFKKFTHLIKWQVDLMLFVYIMDGFDVMWMHSNDTELYAPLLNNTFFFLCRNEKYPNYMIIQKMVLRIKPAIDNW